MDSLSFVCGLGLGVLNWWALYRLYQHVFLKNASFKGFWRKLGLALLFILKTLILFAVLYLVIVVFKLNVVYFLSGLVISLVAAIVFAFRIMKRSE